MQQWLVSPSQQPETLNMLLSSCWVKEDFGGAGGGRFSLALGSGLDSRFLSPLLPLNAGTSLAASFFVLFLFSPVRWTQGNFPQPVFPQTEKADRCCLGLCRRLCACSDWMLRDRCCFGIGGINWLGWALCVTSIGQQEGIQGGTGESLSSQAFG